MKESILNFLAQPLVIGLLIGLLFAILIWIRCLLKAAKEATANDEKRRLLRAEISTLQKHLHTQMQISAKGNEATLAELEELKKQNGNLREVVAELKTKPGRVEIRTLHLYEKAIRLMNARAPGFGPVWESVMVDAEAEVKQEESGILSWIRKPFTKTKALEEGAGRPENTKSLLDES